MRILTTCHLRYHIQINIFPEVAILILDLLHLFLLVAWWTIWAHTLVQAKRDHEAYSL